MDEQSVSYILSVVRFLLNSNKPFGVLFDEAQISLEDEYGSFPKLNLTCKYSIDFYIIAEQEATQKGLEISKAFGSIKGTK